MLTGPSLDYIDEVEASHVFVTSHFPLPVCMMCYTDDVSVFANAALSTNIATEGFYEVSQACQPCHL